MVHKIPNSSAVNMLVVIQCVMRNGVVWFLFNSSNQWSEQTHCLYSLQKHPSPWTATSLSKFVFGAAKTKFGLLTWEMERLQGMGSPGFMLNDVIHTQKDLTALSIAVEEIMAQLCTFLSHFFSLVQSHNAQGPFGIVQEAWMKCSQGYHYVNELSLT